MTGNVAADGMEIAREIVSRRLFDGNIPAFRFDLRASPICARDVTRRWSGALEQNKPRRLVSIFRRSRRGRSRYCAVALFSGARNSGNDSAARHALGSLECDLLSDPLRLL